MRIVEDHLSKAAEFEAFAATATNDVLRTRYADIAACYRLLAKGRQWLIGAGGLEDEQPITVERRDSSSS
jgi:hypothetical protein